MPQPFPNRITYLDLFSGTGGFAKGLQQAGFVFKKHYYSEIDKYAAANYQYNFRDGQQLGDIKKVSGKQIERPDIITFGSPCQDISLAGKRSGLKGKRSGLFFEAIRLIKECRPRLFVFENVKGIFSSNGGKDFEAVLRAFADIGLYDCQWQLLNTAWFLPQNRERIYLVGTLRSEAGQQIFPIGESPRLSQKVGATRTGGGENIASAITSNYSKGVHGRGETYVRVMHWKNSKEKWVQEDKDKIPTLKTQSDLTRQPLIVSKVSYRIPEATKKGFATATEGDGINLSYLSANKKRGRVGKGQIHTLDTGTNHYTIQKGRIRRLTPIECERLQGFPDNWTEYGLFDGEVQEISDTQRYKLLGNAVSVVVVEAVGRKILNKKVALGAIHFQTTTSMDELNGGYKMFKGIALSDAAFKRKHGVSVESEHTPASPDAFVQQVKNDLKTQHVHNKRSLEQLAATYGITDKNEVKELTELAIVVTARTIAQDDTLFIDEKYHRIVDLYNSQVNLSHRTSQSILLQQYSTPAPIGFLMGIFCGLDQLHKKGDYAFEPSAGNGLLTIAAKSERVYVNEVDELRKRNLQTQGFADVTNRDASIDFSDHRHRFASVLTNPPFGMMDHKILFDGFPIQPLEHVMALRALDCMKDDGKAAIIIGGHTHWDAKGRIQAGKNRLFFNYLYSHYRVADVIQIDGKRLYSRQGTGFNTRLILISGRKVQPEGVAPVYDRKHDVVVHQFDELFVRVMEAMQATKQVTQIAAKRNKVEQLEAEGLKLLESLQKNGLGITSYFDRPPYKINVMKRSFSTQPSIRNMERKAIELLHQLELNGTQDIDADLGAPYSPASNACVVLDTQVPDSMAFETGEALALIQKEVGGDVDNFVRDRLGYPTKKALCKALSAEQTDAVMMGIYNIEARSQGMIIGDQTGIGKGRVAAGMIRYACQQGLKPIFLTEKANLFSDIYRDLYAIGSGHLKPFIVNGRESKTDIKDEDGNIIYQALPYHEQQVIFESRQVPAQYNFVVATYSQFNSPERKPEKPAFLSAIAEDTIFIMDESHNSSGSSNTGSFLQHIVAKAKGVVFLSATFAKRPDNMPIYAMKTAISDCNMSKDDLVEAIQRGGVALQEVLSSQLVAEGQMLRRERSFEGVEVNYTTLTEKAPEHQAIADNITGIVRDIIAFQSDFIDVIVEELDTIAVGEGKEVAVREGTSQAGVDNTPYFSKVFNIINQMLFSIKAASVAEKAIERLKEGKKPVIAFSSTMGSFLEDMDADNGMPVADGSTINADFSEVLRRGLEGVMRYTEKNPNGEAEYKKFEVSELSPEGQAEYLRISNRINEISTGITLSPIDVVIKKIREAGYTVAEVTGRKFELQLSGSGSRALVMARKKINTNDAFRQFNNNEVDVLMINQSGSTGASAHAIPTAKVPASEVRQRVMIVLQAELDINTEVQKRGRINRTGQIIKPIYDYVTSAIPAENRLMMMLQKKLKSLDANTASNQKQSSKILDVPDFLNKYGDKVVKEYLLENPNINRLLDDPLRLKNKTEGDQGESDLTENAAHKVSGRVAVLSVKMQQDFYAEITERYNDYVSYLQQIGEYDLELEAMNLEAETMNSKIVKMGKGSGSLFSEDSMLETVKANVLKKPFTQTELENLLTEALQGEDPKKLQKELIDDYDEETTWALELEERDLQAKYDELDKRIYTEKKFQKLKTQEERDQYEKDREKQIEQARQKAVEALRTKANARRFYLQKLFRFFYVGRNLNYPIDSFGGYKEYVPTVFLGFLIDFKKKNPFIPSQIKLRFALANSNKYFAMPASYDDIDAIIGASADLPELTKEQILLNWNSYVQENNTDRKTRYIITGNLLQAFSDFKGKLVNYTTHDGKVNKGILMPEHWTMDEKVQDKVSIPVFKALPLIKSLVIGKSITTSTGIGFIRQPGGGYKVIVSMSRKAGGDIYLDKQLLALVDTNNFNKVADKMVALLDEKNIDDFIAIIQNNHSCSVTITRYQFSSMEKQNNVLRNRKPIRLPEPEKEQQHIIDLLELEAEALALELQLLAA